MRVSGRLFAHTRSRWRPVCRSMCQTTMVDQKKYQRGLFIMLWEWVAVSPLKCVPIPLTCVRAWMSSGHEEMNVFSLNVVPGDVCVCVWWGSRASVSGVWACVRAHASFIRALQVISS